MNKDIKSVAYAFISKDINVYFPDGENNCFMMEKLVCAKCNNFWHTALLECYFCGELNYYLYRDMQTNNFVSITNSSGNTNKIKGCINPDCISNKEEKIKELTIKRKGVFELNSGFNLSQNYCVNCASTQNVYKSFKIFVFNEKENEPINEFLNTININKGDILLGKKYSDNKINYGFYFYDGNNKELNYDFDNINDVIEEILKIKSNI